MVITFDTPYLQSAEIFPSTASTYAPNVSLLKGLSGFKSQGFRCAFFLMCTKVTLFSMLFILIRIRACYLCAFYSNLLDSKL
jgi:hypothetical protein